MNTLTAQLLEQFEQLPADDQREFSPRHPAPCRSARLRRSLRRRTNRRRPRDVLQCSTARRTRMPRRGEVWMVDLGLAQKTRPALILSTGYADDDRALVTVVSHTTSLRGSEFEIAVPVPFLKPGAFLVQSVTTVPVHWTLHRPGRLNAGAICAGRRRRAALAGTLIRATGQQQKSCTRVSSHHLTPHQFWSMSSTSFTILMGGQTAAACCACHNLPVHFRPFSS